MGKYGFSEDGGSRVEALGWSGCCGSLGVVGLRGLGQGM